ncbi:MAG: hypothetical protein ACK6DS_16200 [Planctomycetota bacterium]
MAEIKRGQNEEKVSDENGTVENNIVFLRGFFEQLGFEYVSGLEHEFVSVSPPLEDARLEAVRRGVSALLNRGLARDPAEKG